MMAPSVSTPAGFAFTGGASARYSAPRRLFWPITAVALAGSFTLSGSEIVRSACQRSNLIAVTVPTVMLPTVTSELGGRLVTLAICAVIVYEPDPVPAVSGSGIAPKPVNWQPATVQETTTTPTALNV